jgi:tRNA(Ile)-lysidine synthase
LTAALSGGADSVVMLHVLKALAGSLAYRLSALHVNHGLSEHADDWQRSCAEFCALLDVPCVAVRVAVDPADLKGLEAAARKARYGVFAQADTEFLALAHHREDQAETLLLQLLRGAGPRGAAAMPPERALPGTAVRVVRPLLDESRQALRDYAAAHGLRWVEDESNEDPARARNFVRHDWLPQAARRFPGSVGALARAARLQGEAALLLEDLAAVDGAGAIEPGRLDLAAVISLAPHRARNLLRHFLGCHGLPGPPSARLDEFLRQAGAAGTDGGVLLRMGGWDLRAWRGGVWLIAADPAPGATPRTSQWNGEHALALGPGLGHLRIREAEGAGLSTARVAAEGLSVCWRAGGERFQRQRNGPRQRLKVLLQERGVPPWMRRRLPLAYVGDCLAWVPGLGGAWDYLAEPGEAGLELEWVPEPGFGADGRPLAW